MSITQLAFQAVVAQNLIEENEYKVHNLEVTNELTGKTIDDIWDAINGDSGGSIGERIKILEDITQNITRYEEITSISNALNVNQVRGLNVVDVDFPISG
jgi:oligoendopeptidase F